MAAVHPVSTDTLDAPDADFWQECRRRAMELNIPAWQLAEEGFLHEKVDARA